MSIKNLNKESVQKRIPKSDLNHILHYLVMQQIKAKQTGVPLQSFPHGRHRYFLFTYYKSFQVVNRLKDTALSLMKRQFIKKPRNPE
jgi:hypothetical protein